MAYEIVFAPRALRDLEAIETYLIERSPTGARNVLAAIKRAIDGLQDFPRLGTPINVETADTDCRSGDIPIPFSIG